MKKQKTGIDLLPPNAQKELFACYAKKGDKIEVYADPQVTGTFAVRVWKQKFPYDKEAYEEEFQDLCWYKEEFDECEFTTWPPTSGGVQMF